MDPLRAKLLRRATFKMRHDLTDRSITSDDDEVNVVFEDRAREDAITRFPDRFRESPRDRTRL
jgi:hypothetical protein